MQSLPRSIGDTGYRRCGLREAKSCETGMQKMQDTGYKMQKMQKIHDAGYRRCGLSEAKSCETGMQKMQDTRYRIQDAEDAEDSRCRIQKMWVERSEIL
jgi:hypothetical protein